MRTQTIKAVGLLAGLVLLATGCGASSHTHHPTHRTVRHRVVHHDVVHHHVVHHKKTVVHKHVVVHKKAKPAKKHWWSRSSGHKSGSGFRSRSRSRR